MRMESLIEFSKIAETLNFSSAAEQLYVTETALSRHIKKLEAEIGAPLFYRTTRRVSLTPLGQRLLPYAQQCSALKSEMDAVVAAQLHSEKTVLTISAIEVAGAYIDLPRLLSAFTALHPNIQLNFITPASPVHDPGCCELSLIPELSGFEDPACNRVRIHQDRLLALVPAGHPLAGADALKVEDLKGEQLLLISSGSPLFHICKQICNYHKFQPKVVLTLSSGSSIRAIAEQGVGIGLLLAYPSAQLHDDFPEGDRSVFLDFKDPVSVDFNLVYRPNLSVAGKTFLSFFKKCMAEGSFLL